jgi:CBS domain-containing protein
VVIAGPLASAGLALAFLALSWAGAAAGAPQAVRGVFGYLALINGLLLGFNLVPALPLDGGRLLHAFLWRRQGDRAAATISAAKAGRAFAFLLMTIGLVGVFAGGDIGGLWLVFLGWFLHHAVWEETTYARLEQVFSELRVGDLMSPDPLTVDPGTTIAEFARHLGRGRPHSTYPVVDHGQVVGLLPVREAGAVPRTQRSLVRVADVMLPAAEVPVVHPNDPILGALEAVGRAPGRAVVLDGDTGRELVGVLSATDVAHALEAAPLREQPRCGPGAGSVSVLGWW